MKDPLERNKIKDQKPKSGPTSINKKSTKTVKNALFNFHREEVNKSVKASDTHSDTKAKTENFQPPMLSKEKSAKKNIGSFSKPQNNIPSNSMTNTFVLTPNIDNNPRSNYEQMGQTFMGGGFMEIGTPVRNDYYNPVPNMLSKSPYMQSQSPAMRTNFGNRNMMDTPQTGMSHGRFNMRNDNLNLSDYVSNLFLFKYLLSLFRIHL